MEVIRKHLVIGILFLAFASLAAIAGPLQRLSLSPVAPHYQWDPSAHQPQLFRPSPTAELPQVFDPHTGAMRLRDEHWREGYGWRWDRDRWREDHDRWERRYGWDRDRDNIWHWSDEPDPLAAGSANNKPPSRTRYISCSNHLIELPCANFNLGQ